MSDVAVDLGRAVLGVDNLSLRFGAVTALDAVTFTVGPGEWVAVIGPNGSGKSSLMNCIAGQYIPSSGKIAYCGIDLAGSGPGSRRRRGITRTFQNLMLAHDLNLRENIMIGCEQKAVGRPAAIGNVDAAIEEWGIAPYAYRFPEEVPYGIRKLAEIVRALMRTPRLLLLDEPIAGLSPPEREAVARNLVDLRARRPTLTVLVVEHDIRFVSELCSTLVALAVGQLLAMGAPEEVLSDSRVVASYVGDEEAS
ncbi:MAG: ABC transporter ATP-binding protein [Acidimicrobiales bacterium]